MAWLRALSETTTSPQTLIEDVAAMDGVAAPLDQEHEQVEIAGDERLLAPVAEQHAPSRREDEFVEAIPGHVFSVARGRRAPGHRISVA